MAIDYRPSQKILLTKPRLDSECDSNKMRNECTLLGMNFANATKKYADEDRLNVVPVNQFDSQSEGLNLELQIVNAFGAGNAFIGHRKSVSITGRLFKDGGVIEHVDGTGNSGGGFMGGFKGSCAVLEHTVNTLGNDVAKWLKLKVKTLSL